MENESTKADQETHWFTQKDFHMRYGIKGYSWDPQKKRRRPVTWAPVFSVYCKGLWRREPFRVMGMATMNGDMLEPEGRAWETQTGRRDMRDRTEERQDELMDDDLMTLSQRDHVDPVQVQMGRLWRGVGTGDQ